MSFGRIPKTRFLSGAFLDTATAITTPVCFFQKVKDFVIANEIDPFRFVPATMLKTWW